MNDEKSKGLHVAMDPRLRPVKMTLKEAETDLSNAVYAASELLERLEGAGLIRGNGHHARQGLAEKAVEDLRRRWIGPKDGD